MAKSAVHPLQAMHDRNAAIARGEDPSIGLPTGPSTPVAPPEVLLHEGVTGEFGSPAELFAAQPEDRTEDLHLADEPKKLKCPECDTMNMASADKCKNCGHDLTEARKAKFANMSLPDRPEGDPLYLSVSQGERDELKKKGLGYALPDGSFPIRNKSDLKKAIDLRGHGNHPQIMAHLKAAAKRLGAEDMLPGEENEGSGNDGDEKKLALPEEAATIYQHLEFAIEEGGNDGLIWKCVCEEGTLALSPGPGQIDVEKPLNLTGELMDELKTSVDEKAFPYVTIPETHNNSLLENTGYVRKAEVRTNPATGKKQLWCGLDFTEPDVKERVQRGSIADTSVGIKFNFRNKRSGKTYPAALEHVNLTNQPWVDGMTPFGERAMLSQEPYDQDEFNEDAYRGVYIGLSQEAASETEEEQVEEEHEEPEGTSDAGDILPDVTPDDSLLSMPKEQRTVEQVLAEQQATIERQNAKLEEQDQKLALAQGTISSQGEQLHASRVDADIKKLVGKVPPAVLVRAREIKLADKRPTGQEGSLELSIKGENDEIETKKFGPSEIVDYLLSALPESKEPISDELALALDEHSSVERKPAELDTTSAADDIEREMHPERFDAEGKRKETV